MAGTSQDYRIWVGGRRHLVDDSGKRINYGGTSLGSPWHLTPFWLQLTLGADTAIKAQDFLFGDDLGKLQEGGRLVQAQGNGWAPLIFQDFFMKGE